MQQIRAVKLTLCTKPFKQAQNRSEKALGDCYNTQGIDGINGSKVMFVQYLRLQSVYTVSTEENTKGRGGQCY